MVMKVSGFAAHSATTDLAPWSFERRDPRPDDVAIDILFCGVCHSDIHNARNEWGGAIYPMVPGHEIIGRVSSVGAKVSRFKVGAPLRWGSRRVSEPCSGQLSEGTMFGSFNSLQGSFEAIS